MNTPSGPLPVSVRGAVSDVSSAALNIRKTIDEIRDQPRALGEALSWLHREDPLAFTLAALSYLDSPDVPGAKFLIHLIVSGDRLADVLDATATVSLPSAIRSVKTLVELESKVAAQIMRPLAKADVTEDRILRTLAMVEPLGEDARITPFLAQLMRNPSARVRSKALLLLGKINLNADRTNKFLSLEDARERANVVESLWPWADRSVALLRVASRDTNHRVACNAMVGLCLAGKTDGYVRLREMAQSLQVSARRAAAWAMGRAGSPQFLIDLERLKEDSDGRVRLLAEQSIGWIAPEGQTVFDDKLAMDRRKQPRITGTGKLSVSAEVLEAAKCGFEAKVVDVSANGLQIRVPLPLGVGTAIKLAFHDETLEGVVVHSWLAQGEFRAGIKLDAAFQQFEQMAEQLTGTPVGIELDNIPDVFIDALISGELSEQELTVLSRH